MFQQSGIILSALENHRLHETRSRIEGKLYDIRIKYMRTCNTPRKRIIYFENVYAFF